MKRPAFVGMGVLWLVVVLAVSTLTWTVIDSAGQDVLSSGEEVLIDDVPSPRAEPSAARSAEVERGDDKPSRTPRATASPRPTAGTTTAPATPPTSPPATSPPATSPPAAPQGQVRSWQGTAGTVSARCEGTRISLQSAYPRDGWRIEVKKRGPSEVDVELESGGEDERRTRVRAECAGGTPRFEVDADD